MPKTLYVDNSVIPKDKKYTFLTTDAVAGATTIGLQSTLGFTSLSTSSGQILLIGELGQETAELIKTSNVSTTTGSNIGGTSATLIAGLRFAHPQDTKVTIVDWDRFEVQHATTATGSKTTLMAYPEPIQPDHIESLYRDTTQTSGYYFIRFNETVGSTNSDWSDPIPFGGYTDDTVFAIKQRALEQLNETVDGELISNEFLDRCLWEGRREYHNLPGKRPFRRKFNQNIGTVTTGMYRIVMPADVQNPSTAENVYGVRIGAQRNLYFYDKKDFDRDYVDKPHTTLSTAYTVGDQDLYITNAENFADSGSVTIEDDTIIYSARGISGGTLRISTAGADSHAVSSDVWQNASFGLPTHFTVWADVGGSSYIYFNRPIDTTYASQIVYMDYYRTVVDKDSDADQLDEPQYDMFVPYLKWRIKQRKNNGLNPLTDPDYQEWTQRKLNSLATEYAGTEIRIFPDISHLP